LKNIRTEIPRKYATVGKTASASVRTARRVSFKPIAHLKQHAVVPQEALIAALKMDLSRLLGGVTARNSPAASVIAPIDRIPYIGLY
jgi:hypothetical protein